MRARTSTRREIVAGTRIHAKKRARSRYGVNLNHAAYSQICSMIQERQSLSTVKMGGRLLCLLEYQGQELVAIYSIRRREIITFLPPDCEERPLLEAARKEVR